MDHQATTIAENEDDNLHINDTILLRAMPAPPTTPQRTKFYIPLAVEHFTAFSLQDRMTTTQSIFSTPLPLQNRLHAFIHYRASYISRRTTDNYYIRQLMPTCGTTTA